jgi:riboflavin biosynthesis pyrimidine reductase
MSATPPIATTESSFEVLFDRSAPAMPVLPEALAHRYGGDLRIDAPCIYANFVSAIDGVVSLEVKHSPSIISRRSDADRFVMGLLRAYADAVLIGGATLRADPGHIWTADYIYPDAARDFDDLRRRRGQARQPRLVVLSGSGRIDPDEPALDGALVLTRPDVGLDLMHRLPSSASVRTLESITAERIASVLGDEGLDLVLSEAGPRLFGELVRSEYLGELFLTVSPVIAGSAAEHRKTLSADIALDADALADMELVTVRRSDSHLFLRYRRVVSSPSNGYPLE